MTAQIPEIQGVTIVLLGDFNPKIFQPAWFAHHELINNYEIEDATIKIVHPDVVSFTLGWMELNVTRDKFTITTLQEPHYRTVFELVIRTFKLLEHTPLRYLGINQMKHYRMKDENEWHDLGDMLAPKNLWRDIFKKPGMRSLTMEEGVRPDNYNGYIRVTIEPSDRIRPGVFFQVNDHFQVKDPDTNLGAAEIFNILLDAWSESIRRSDYIINSILEAR